MRELNASKLNEQAKVLNKKLTACRSVKRVLKQKGWRAIIQPLVERMIDEVVGGKVGDKYCKAKLCEPDNHYEYWVGYKQALMDLNNRVWSYPESIEMYKERIKRLEEQVKAGDEYETPMMGGKYAG